MITNEREYKITRRALGKFETAIREFDVDALADRNISNVLAQVELRGLETMASRLSEQIREYEELKSGAVDVLKAESLDELPGILIRARIARGLTQAQLAERIGVKEQQIQRYEAEEYGSASLRRLIEISNALELEISETAQL